MNIYAGMAHEDEAILALLPQGAHQYVRKGPLGELLKAVQMSFRSKGFASFHAPG